MPSPRILINARAAARPELGGVERWAREMVTRLPKIRPESYEVAMPPRRFVHRAGHVWEQAVLPLLARKQGADLLFSPANLAPLGFPRNVVVIHDAAALRESDWYSRSYKAMQQMLLPQIARRALHVITVSEFSKTELLQYLPITSEKISVVPGAAGEEFLQASPDEKVLARYGLKRPYLLTVGSQTARKNLAVLERGLIPTMRVSGMETYAVGGTRPQFRNDPGAEDTAANALGAVLDQDLPAIYAGAFAFLMPSLYEGFGLPCLEAMAAGTPVIAANTSALPETCADAALYADPYDSQQFVDRIDELKNDDDLREKQIAKGRKRAAQFSWQRTASAVDQILIKHTA